MLQFAIFVSLNLRPKQTVAALVMKVVIIQRIGNVVPENKDVTLLSTDGQTLRAMQEAVFLLDLIF